jgi:branched-chain amino acid transport system substrate-binding protein
MRTVFAFLLAWSFALVPFSGRAADTTPFELNVITPLTGTGTFVGKAVQESLGVLEGYVNKQGGINGRPVKFVYYDDQTNPQVGVQLANEILAKKPAVILGSGIVAICSAVAALTAANGPVQYCFSPGIHPAKGSYVFSSAVSTVDQIGASLNYFRLRGLTKIAVITSTDASGQDAENSINEELGLPENKAFTVVEREHFNTSDISVAAQMSRIKAAGPQALIAWSTGTPAGTLLRGAKETGLDIPILTTSGNLTYTQMAQYAAFMPKELYFPTIPSVGDVQVADKATREQIDAYHAALAAAGLKADYPRGSAWDPALIVITAYRKLGTNATATQIRDFIDNLKGWTGINGPYDFRAVPQRGLGVNAAVVVRWDAAKGTWVGVSKPGGTPL